MILCCGKALLDVTRLQHEPALKPPSGGAMFNTTIGIKREGVDVGLVFKLSKDLSG